MAKPGVKKALKGTKMGKSGPINTSFTSKIATKR
jgi:hypothetical protein